MVRLIKCYFAYIIRYFSCYCLDTRLSIVIKIVERTAGHSVKLYQLINIKVVYELLRFHNDVKIAA